MSRFDPRIEQTRRRAKARALAVRAPDQLISLAMYGTAFLALILGLLLMRP